LSWIGTTSAPPVRQDTRVAVGHPPRIGEATRSSKSHSRCRTADPAPAGSSVPTVSQPRRAASSRCVRKHSIRPYKPHANGKPPRRSKPRMRCGQASRERFHKAFGRSDYVRRATEDKRKSICSTSSPPPHSISAGCMAGRLRSHERKHDKPPSCAWPRKGLKWMSF
jgi:hypothetical protein